MLKLYDTFTCAFKRCKLLVLVLMCLAFAMEAKNPIGRRHHNNDTKAFICKPTTQETRTSCENKLYSVAIYCSDVSIGLIVFVAILILGYCARELCPRGPIFTSLDLDEIRLDHLDDIESSLQKNINALKVNIGREHWF